MEWNQVLSSAASLIAFAFATAIVSKIQRIVIRVICYILIGVVVYYVFANILHLNIPISPMDVINFAKSILKLD